GHFDGQEVIPASEMVNKVRAAVEARRDGVFIIARTDARTAEGFDAAIDRACCYIEAGADMTFVEAPKMVDALRKIPQLLTGRQLLNMVVRRRPPPPIRPLPPQV